MLNVAVGVEVAAAMTLILTEFLDQALLRAAMSVAPYLVAVWLLLIGLYGVITSRHLVHLVLCLSVMQASTYVLLLAVGYRTGGQAPIFADIPPGTPVVDPVVQALTLTDVVVEATVDRGAARARRPGAQALRHGRPRPARRAARVTAAALSVLVPFGAACVLAGDLPVRAPPRRAGRAVAVGAGHAAR